ncbi:signal peptidase 22kDa subunit [Polychytrium aggregatum]|uniref:signal peptidase 22kDa subunit n=1 Tax=Polychytrium aggregatum TaxID=110093 RepID=UPI0022FE0BFF|nr:signal peptidase 22kDa subunit [Polychytrium aggregatum]KAI9208242.1 signal peptidase 22kDa subunit [Polychytrium aggregatum]
MYGIQQRANNVFATFLSVAFAVVAIVAATSELMLRWTPAPEINVSVNHVQLKIGRDSYYSPKSEQLATLSFNLEADLTPLFNWNTKQVFAYLVAEFDTKDYSPNQVTIWDDIITSKEDAYIKLKDKRQKYNLIALNDRIENANASLSLHWNVNPYMGLLSWNHGGHTKIDMRKAPAKTKPKVSKPSGKK